MIAILLSGALCMSCAMRPETDKGVEAEQLLNLVRSDDPPMTLDTRSAAEYNAGHVPGARHFPFWKSFWLAGKLDYPKDAPVIVYCEHGPRASIARYALERKGFTSVTYLQGHMSGWKREDLPVETGKGGRPVQADSD